jgi:hypothetical protein
MTSSATLTESLFEELDYRENDGIEVWLLWSREDGRLSVVVFDGETNESFEIAVEPATALDVFTHPFAYASREACAA